MNFKKLIRTANRMGIDSDTLILYPKKALIPDAKCVVFFQKHPVECLQTLETCVGDTLVHVMTREKPILVQRMCGFSKQKTGLDMARALGSHALMACGEYLSSP